MIGDVVKKAGEGVGSAVGSGVESVAGGYIDFMLPWGLVALGVIFLLIRAIR